MLTKGVSIAFEIKYREFVIFFFIVIRKRDNTEPDGYHKGTV